MSLNHITFNKPSVLFVIFIWPQESSTTSKLHSSLSSLDTGCSRPSLTAAIFSLALLNASSTEFTLGKELMMMMEAVGIKVVIMGICKDGQGVSPGEEGCRAESVHQELSVVPSIGYFATHQKSLCLINMVRKI